MCDQPVPTCLPIRDASLSDSQLLGTLRTTLVCLILSSAFDVHVYICSSVYVFGALLWIPMIKRSSSSTYGAMHTPCYPFEILAL